MKAQVDAILRKELPSADADSILRISGQISALMSEIIREERLSETHFQCAICQCAIQVSIDIGSSNLCSTEGTCTRCGMKHSVQFVKSIEPRLIRPHMKPREVNGKLF